MLNQTVLIIEDSHQEKSGVKQLLQDEASVSYRLLSQSQEWVIAGSYQSQQIDGIDGIVLDASVDPLKVLSQIRQQRGESCPPIVVVGEDRVETAVQLLKAGAADYLVRSHLTSEQLCLALQHAIAQSTPACPSPPCQLDQYQQTENALQAANQKISRILESMTDAFVALDRDWRITYINQTAARINQVSPDVLIGQSHWDVWPETRDELEARYQHAIATQTPTHFDYFYTARQRWYEIHAYPSADGLGLYFRDIFDRKQAEETLRRNEERLRLAVEGAQMATWDVDLVTGKATWSDLHFTMLGYEPTATGEASEALWSQRIHPDDRQRVYQEWQQSRQERRYFRVEYRVVRADNGQISWLEGLGNFIYDDSGEAIRSSGVLFDISDRKQAEDTLAQRETELRLVTNTVPALISFVDAEGCYRFVNHRYETWFGKPASSIYGKHLREVLGENAYETIRPHVEQVMAGQEVSYEVQIPYQDGGARTVNATYVPRFNQQGEVEGFVALVHDISDRKQAEVALRQSEDRLRMALESARLGTWDWNLITNELVWDASCKRILGLPPDAESSIETFYAGLHPDDCDRLEQIIQDVLNPASNSTYDTEYRTIGIQDGIERWVLAKGQAYFDPDGTPRRFIGTVLDITDRKQAEAALRDSETRFRQMTDIAPMLVWMSGTDKLCSYFNQSWLTFTGRTLEQEMGNGWAKGVHPNDLEYCWHVYTTAFDARRSFEMEYRLRRFDGEYRWILDVGVPRFTPEGEFLGYLGSCFDIHDRRQAEDEREQLLQREQAARETAERANRVKDEFLTVLSHELRSPLNPILGWAKLLQRRKFDDAQTAQALATIERNAKLQTQLIDDLLDVARILRGKLKLNQVPLNLASVLESAIETMRKSAEAKSITLHADVADIGQVYGDNTRLQQILWNLLSNAIKFTPSGGRVEVRLERVSGEERGCKGVREQDSAAPPLPPAFSLSASHAHIIVTDTGKGIKSDFLHHIFESFRQEDASTTRQYGGLGLGLAIVRYLVNAHGGTIAADSAGEGQGATFTVCLPLLKTKTRTQKLDERLPPQDIELAGMRILIVDDEPDARELLETLLAQYGATIQAAASAADALLAMATFQPNLLVSDIGMPDMDGYRLIQQIRTLPADQGGNIPAIALTAYAREIDSQQALANGYQRHIAKPLDLERLLQAILSLSRESINS